MRRQRFEFKWLPEKHLDEPRDQFCDLLDALWAEVGPDSRSGPGGWSWGILDFDDDNALVAFGFTSDEKSAKDAVAAWALRTGVIKRNIFGTYLIP